MIRNYLPPNPIAVSALQDFQIKIVFTDGKTKIFDIKPYLKGRAYYPLLENGIFNQVSILNGNVSWLNGKIDISPENLYFDSVEV